MQYTCTINRNSKTLNINKSLFYLPVAKKNLVANQSQDLLGCSNPKSSTCSCSQMNLASSWASIFWRSVSPAVFPKVSPPFLFSLPYFGSVSKPWRIDQNSSCSPGCRWSINNPLKAAWKETEVSKELNSWKMANTYTLTFSYSYITCVYKPHLRVHCNSLSCIPAGWRLGALRKLHHSAVLAIGAGEWYLTVTVTCGFFGPIHTKKKCTEKMRFG